MKTKFYITTYNNNEILNDWILKSLHESDYDRDNVEIFVIDNHSNVHINDEYSSFVKVLANNLRPDFSTGHLSRNHNQAIINGFESLINPKCDVVVSCQNDTKVLKNWYQTLCEAMKTYTFLTVGAGDQFQAWKAEGVRNIGLYDERFCGITQQEADYFLRSYLYNKEYSSINDGYHGRVHNELTKNIIEVTLSGYGRGEPSHLESHKNSLSVNLKLFHKKWGNGLEYGGRWYDHDNLHELVCLTDNYVMYPYFEKDILNLTEKRFIAL